MLSSQGWRRGEAIHDWHVEIEHSDVRFSMLRGLHGRASIIKNKHFVIDERE